MAQLVRALHQNRRAVGLIPVRGPIVAFFTASCSLLSLKMYIIHTRISSKKTFNT